MSENTATTTETTQVEQPEQVEEAAKKDTDWKAEARKWEQRAKANYSAVEKLQALEDEKKSELEKAQDKAAQALQEAENAKREAARFRIAATHKISDEYFDLLTGSTEDELTAQAEKISQLIASTKTPHTVIPAGAEKDDLALNGDGIENALKNALGIR